MSSNGLLQADDQASLISVKSIEPSPDTLTSEPISASRVSLSTLKLSTPELVRRIRTLTLTLLPVEVPLESIDDPTSRIITPQVITAYMAAAGDLLEAVSLFSKCRCTRIWIDITNLSSYLIVFFVRGRSSCGMRTITLQIMERTLAEVGSLSRILAVYIGSHSHRIATACEVLARRVIHKSPPDKVTSMMSSRFIHREVDGDESEKVSALEMAIDSHW